MRGYCDFVVEVYLPPIIARSLWARDFGTATCHCQCLAEIRCHSQHVRSNANHIEPSLCTVSCILCTCAVYTYLLSLRMSCILDAVDSLSQLVVNACDDGMSDVVTKVERSNEQAIHTRNGSDLTDVFECGLGLDLDDSLERGVCILQVVCHCFVVESLRREGRAEAAMAFWWKFGRGDEAFCVIYGIDQGNENAVGSSVESS
jgi:hypothetical protein